MPLIPFPNVPNLPGVPSIPRSPRFPSSTAIGLGIVQGTLWRVLQQPTKWGVFDSQGNALADPGKFGKVGEAVGLGSSLSTNAVDYQKEMRVSDFPLEKGGFANYNKVELPATPSVTLVLGGSEADRSAFLDAVDAATKSTETFSVVTPEVTYINYTIERYNYQRRNTRGAYVLIVELLLKEIREVSAQYSQVTKQQISVPKDVGASPKVDGGKVQARKPDVSTLKSLSNKLGTLF